ncbi:hypothetical protein Avbf_11967 [Armadillidium vulgare]|nr:hypothetical protein Avbf_11967 [Armadillidium vulgare]
MGHKKLSIEEKARCLNLLEEGWFIIDVATDMKVSSYYVCNGDNLVAVNCSQNFCFNQESCACVEKS